jgi:hypothetical protein
MLCHVLLHSWWNGCSSSSSRSSQEGKLRE